jgi:hypothetical protein
MPEDLGTDLSVLADTEDRAGHGQEAIDVERIALRQHYAALLFSLTGSEPPG